MLLIFLAFYVLLLCVLTFFVPFCYVRYDFRIIMMFGSPLHPVVCRRTRVLLCFLCMFEYSDVQHSAVAPLFCFLRCIFVLFIFVMCLVYPMLAVSLDCTYFIAPSVVANVYFKRHLSVLSSPNIKSGTHKVESGDTHK